MTRDGSEASIEAVNALLTMLHDQLGEVQPDEETVWTFATCEIFVFRL